jgi:hypothetical protein
MRISWLTADEIAIAREALMANGKSWEDHFVANEFVGVPKPDDTTISDWREVTEHVARAERVSQVVRDFGIEDAQTKFGGSPLAIEAATLASAQHEGAVLDVQQVMGVLARAIDPLVFYAPFLELLIEKGKADVELTVRAYEDFVTAYARALVDVPRSHERIGAVRDGLADFYVSVGKLDEAEALFQQRHDEDQADVAVALSASRAFLAAGSVSHAVRWLGVGADRATDLGRADLATRLREKQGRVRERLS